MGAPQRWRKKAVRAQGGGDPALAAMREADFWYDTRDIATGAEQTLPNRGSGVAFPAVRGSTSHAAIVAEGLYVPPDQQTNYASSPDSAQLNVLGDFDLRVQCAPFDYTDPAPGGSFLVAKAATASNQRSWAFSIVNNTLEFRWFDDRTATAAGTRNSSPLTELPGVKVWFRVTLDVDDGAGNHVITFYRSSDGVTWTAISADTSAGVTSIITSTAAVRIGSNSSANFGGRTTKGATFAKVELRNGIDGTIVASPDFVAATDGATVITDAQSNVWTVTATSGVDTNDPVFLPHTGENYVSMPGTSNNAFYLSGRPVPAGDFTVEIEAFLRDPGGSNQGLVGQYLTTTGNRCWAFRANGGALNVYLSVDGVLINPSTIPGFGALVTANQWFTILFDVNLDPGGAVVTATVTPEGGSPTVLTGVTSFTAADVYQSPIDPPVVVGARFHTGSSPSGASEVMNGGVRRVAINGTEVFDAATDLGDITVERSASGLKTAVVTRPVSTLDGIDDFFQLNAALTPTFTATTGKHTVLLFGRWGGGDVVDRLWSSESASYRGLLFQVSGVGDIQVAIGGASAGPASRTAPGGALDVGETFIVAAIVSDGLMYAYRYGHGLSTSLDFSSYGSLVFAAPRIGSRSDLVNNVWPGEIMASLTFKDQALTEPELDLIAAKLIAGTYA